MQQRTMSLFFYSHHQLLKYRHKHHSYKLAGPLITYISLTDIWEPCFTFVLLFVLLSFIIIIKYNNILNKYYNFILSKFKTNVTHNNLKLIASSFVVGSLRQTISSIFRRIWSLKLVGWVR